MKRLLIAALCCTGLAMPARGQNGWLPPVNFPSNSNVCDNSPWKLVFYDNFDGNTLDHSKWRTYNAWAGMPWPPGETDNWQEGRSNDRDMMHILRDDNVTVSNGECHLFFKHDKGSWHCDTCTHYTYYKTYTGGAINTYYGHAYNNGRFEARIKYPTFKWAHCDFWLWPGGDISNIDIAEEYGNPYWRWMVDNNRRVAYSLHAMVPRPDNAVHNPYHITHDIEVGTPYPNQTWWDYVRHTFFDPNNYHVYTLEWDTAKIDAYVDGQLFSRNWKYYQDQTYRKWDPLHIFHKDYTVMVGSGCNPTGTWKVLEGFPYNNNSACAIRITNGIDRDIADANDNSVWTMGQLDVDYVKVWQKHPEENGNVDLCNSTIPVISGPNLICDRGTFTVNPPINGGSWTLMGALNATGGSNSYITVARNAASTVDGGIVRYNYHFPIEGCPDQTVYRMVDVGPPSSATKPVITRGAIFGQYNERYYLLAEKPTIPNAPAGVSYSTYSSPTTFEWDIDYGYNFQYHMHALGQYITTPYQYFPYLAGGFKYTGVKWTLKITNGCGTTTVKGKRTWINPSPFGMRTTATTADTTASDDTTTADYYDAVITDTADYEQRVYDRVAHTFVDLNDTVAVNSMIDKISIEELRPYIQQPDEDTTKMLSKFGPMSNPLETGTKLYPNPVSNELNIDLGSSFAINTGVEIVVADITGKECAYLFMNHTGNTIKMDVSKLLKGNLYVVRLKQNDHIEQQKLLK